MKPNDDKAHLKKHETPSKNTPKQTNKKAPTN